MLKARFLKPVAVGLGVLMLNATVPVAALAQVAADESVETPAPPTAASIDQARELIRNGDYDGAIDILKSSVEQAKERTEDLREAYLLLIQTYVFIGNDLKFKPQGREASNLNYERAKTLIAEALSVPALRHTKPEPASDYPPEMVDFFAEVRGQIFGSFRVSLLEPAEAIVTLGGDTLGMLPADSTLGDVDLPLGQHLVVVRAEGYQDITEEITISPGATLERSYQMNKKRGAAWYSVAAAGAAGLVWGLAALISGPGDSGTPPEEPLPGPPGPPSSP